MTLLPGPPSERMPADHVEVALDFSHGLVVYHPRGQNAHLLEIGGNGRKSVEDDFVGRGFVVRNDTYLASDFEIQFTGTPDELYEFGIELAVEDEIHFVFPYDFRSDCRMELCGDVVIVAESCDGFLDIRAVKT